MRFIARAAIALSIIGAVAFAALGCAEEQGGDNRQRAVAHRESTFERATRLFPDPSPQNFPMREALIKFTQRGDLLNHPWYVYIMGDNGNLLGYYVATTKPVNSCNFLSSTEKVYESSNGNIPLTAPSLDGIFYGGGGAAAGCDAWFFFDAATDAMIEIRGVKYYVADAPLRIEAAPIRVGQ